MRIKHKVNVRIAEDAAMDNVLFGPDDALAEITIDSMERQVSGTLSIAAATSENVPLGDITAVKGFYLRVNQDCIVKLNGGVEEFQLRKVGTSLTTYAKMFMEADITQISITTPADVALTGTYCLWGDPAA